MEGVKDALLIILVILCIYQKEFDIIPFYALYILRDFRNAPFYIHCLFHMIDLRMCSLLFFILLQNGP